MNNPIHVYIRYVNAASIAQVNTFEGGGTNLVPASKARTNSPQEFELFVRVDYADWAASNETPRDTERNCNVWRGLLGVFSEPTAIFFDEPLPPQAREALKELRFRGELQIPVYEPVLFNAHLAKELGEACGGWTFTTPSSVG